MSDTYEATALFLRQRVLILQARLAEAERDAARYRWLRKKTAIVSKRRMSGDCYPAFEILDFPSPTHIAPRPDIELDASIDAAMRFADSASSNRPCTLTAPDRETPVT